MEKFWSGWNRSIHSHLFSSVDAASLIVFRVCFGLVLLVHSREYLGGDHTVEMWSGMFFTWQGFEWIRPLSPTAMQAVYWAMAASSVMVMAGFFYRLACAISLVCCVYVFLLERISSVNHDYFLCQLCLLMIFVPANCCFALDSLMFPQRRRTCVPGWVIWLLRLQVGIPYFFGGVAKVMEADWMSGKVSTALLGQVNGWELIGPDGWNIVSPLSAIMTWGGMIFDLVAVPLLIWRRTRPLLFLIAVFFHLVNSFLFRIELFPWLMLAGTFLYLEPDWPLRFWRFLTGGRSERGQSKAECSDEPVGKQRRVCLLFTGWFVLQCLLPLRYFFYTGNPCWTLDCNFFSWRMMLNAKISDCVFFATDEVTRATVKIPLDQYLSAPQYLFMRHDPQLMRQFAGYLSAKLNAESEHHIIVRVIAKSSMNGNDPQWMIYPDMDLGIEPPAIWKSRWVVPYGDLHDYEIPDDLKPFFKVGS